MIGTLTRALQRNGLPPDLAAAYARQAVENASKGKVAGAAGKLMRSWRGMRGGKRAS